MSGFDRLPDEAAAVFGEGATGEEAYGLLTVDVPPASWTAALTTARDSWAAPSSTGSAPWTSRAPASGCAPTSYATRRGGPRRLLLRTTVPYDVAALPTATGVYAGAGWHERETHEMFGVDFTGHPGLAPLLLPEEFEGHPLRKDFVLAARVAKAWPGAKEPGESHDGGPRRRQMQPPGVPDPNDWGPLKGQLPPAPARPARTPRAARRRGRAPGPRRTRSASEGSASQGAAAPGRAAARPPAPRRTPPGRNRRRRPPSGTTTSRESGAEPRRSPGPPGDAPGAAGSREQREDKGESRRGTPPTVRPAGSGGNRDTGEGGGTAVNDTLDVVLRLVAVLAVFLVLPLLVGQTEHKVMAHMQGRLGPMYAGGFHGWAQLVADGVKFAQKEDVVPADADRRIFQLAPAVALLPYLLVLIAIPVGPHGFVGQALDAGLFFVLAVMGVGVLGSLMAGWASANKFSLLGGLRTAAQLMAYELPMLLAAASVAMAAGTLSLPGIVEAYHWWWTLWQLVGGAGVLHRGPRRAAAAAVRHAGRRLRDHLRRVHRVHRAALRAVPARRVRRASSCCAR